jgi:hypothetical protein
MGSWFKKKRNIAVAIGAAVLLVAATVLLIVGVTTHEEPGLLRVCEHAGVILYADRDDVEIIGRPESEEEAYGACERVEELRWPQSQIPLTVAAVASDGTEIPPPGFGDRRRSPLDSAIRDLNRQLGFTLFASVRERTGAAIVVRSGEAVEVDVGGHQGRAPGARAPLGYARHSRPDSATGSDLFCGIGVYGNVGSVRHEYLVAHHELLHCAGLAHDPDNPASAIYPFTSDDTMWEQMEAARITDFDRALLRRLYHR